MKKMLLVHGKTKTQFINYNLIKREEFVKIQEEIVTCLEQYGLSTGDFAIKSVEISKRLKTVAGRCDWRKIPKNSFEIRLAYNNYIEFGFESMIKTLRHEMAHLIEVALYGRSSHSERFKVICVALGGHMNGHIAGKKYSASSTSDYCKKIKKYNYSCSCGMTFGRKRRITNANTLRARCRTCKTMVMDMKMEEI